MRNRSVLLLLVFSILLGLSPLAADPVIRRGVDVFTTHPDGKTHYDFGQNPIPANFFCKGSKAFAQRVTLKGLPLATRIPGQLRGADTIVERLDDAVFDDQGVAVTRLQFRALSLVSAEPIKTACGDFHVYVTLGGKQRVTTMKILRIQENGGTFSAPLAVDARITFVPVKAAKNTKTVELMGSFTFPPNPIHWSLVEDAGMKRMSAAVVDTDGDLTPDTAFSMTSNFKPGVPPGKVVAQNIGPCPCPQPCHYSDSCEHCYYPPDCYPVVCME